MGPMLQFDKSTLEGLSLPEVDTLSRYYSIVLTPILLTEFQTMLAKKSTGKRDLEHILSTLANKVSSRGAYLVANAHNLVRASLFGENVPLNGQVPLPGGKRIRSRDGTFGVFFDEPEEMSILRDWAKKKFALHQKEQAQKIRARHESVDLNKLKSTLSWPLLNLPITKSAEELLKWIDEKILNQNDHIHFRTIASELLSPEEYQLALTKWTESKKSLKEYAPYAHYFHRVNLMFLFGLSTGVVPASKDAKAHLDFEYLYYLPFCFVFTTKDDLSFRISKALARKDQSIVHGEDLKGDLKILANFYKNNPEMKSDGTGYPPEEVNGPTLESWKKSMRPRKDLIESKKSPTGNFSAKDMIKKLNESVFADDPKKSFRPPETEPLTLVNASKQFCSGIKIILEKISSNWEEVREKFNSENVRSIYNLHADLWHPANKLEQQIEVLSQNGRQRLIYSGPVETWDISNLYELTQFFDQILIPNPFPSPWARQADFNPLNKADQYQLDTLKLAYFLMSIGPLIESEKIVLIPNPIDYDPKLQSKWLEISTERSSPEKQLDENILKRLKHTELFLILRSLARLPEDRRRIGIASKFGKEMEEDFFQFSEALIKRDPVTIKRLDFTEDLVIFRGGLNLEAALILSRLYEADLLISDISLSKDIISLIEDSDPAAKEKIIKKQTKISACTDPIFPIVLHKTGEKTSLTKILEQLNTSNLSLSEITFDEHESEVQVFAEIQQDTSDHSAADLIYPIEITVAELNEDLIKTKLRPFGSLINIPASKSPRKIAFIVPPSEIPLHP